jgi:hypothetical protein
MTSKLLWNSVLSTTGAKHMFIDIKNFYLTATLDYYEYMKIPLALFPEWIKIQYNLNTHVTDGFVFLEIRRAVWGLPQAGIFMDITNVSTPQACGVMQQDQLRSPLWMTILESNTWVKNMQTI